MNDSEKEVAYRKQVLKTFFKNGMLLKLPSQNRKKDVVLQKISTRFVQNQMYSDNELNEILKKLFPDFAKLKAELINSRFMKITKGLYHLS